MLERGRLSFFKGEGEGEGLASSPRIENPSPQSSPLHAGERRIKKSHCITDHALIRSCAIISCAAEWFAPLP